MIGENKTETVAASMINEGAPTGAPSGAKKRGRPKGSKNKPRDPNTGQRIESPSEPISFIYNPDPAGIAAAGKAFSTVWFLLGPLLKVRPLTEQEELKTGEALDPVLQKYVPMYNDWKYEINLSLVIVGLFQVCRKDWIKEHPPSGSEAEVINDD